MARLVSMNFRTWLQEQWFKYRDECDAYMQQPVLDSSQYFKMYKYWLKREYKHQRNNNV